MAKFLFIHQNYPAQYKHILQWLVDQGGHTIVFLTQRKVQDQPHGVRVISYTPDHVPAEGAYPYVSEFEKCCANGVKVAEVCRALNGQRFIPDVVIGHSGWGEMLFVKGEWPDVPVLSYFEYFYSANGGAVGFDPEFPISDAMPNIMRARNATNYLSFDACDLGQTATHWQKSGYPESFHDKLTVIHEGIRTDLCVPNPAASVTLGRVAAPVTREDEVFTYMARNLEPVRGFHIFMRALPHILDERPNARVLIIGGKDVSYGRRPDHGETYRGMLEREVGDRIDWSRVHFLGKVPYEIFVAVMQLTRCHVYLTVPFVPSWSMMEAMSCGATVVSSDVAPVREIIDDGTTGYLVDFLNPDALAQRVIDVLADPEANRHIGLAARQHIVEEYDFKSVIRAKYVDLLNGLLVRDCQI